MILMMNVGDGLGPSVNTHVFFLLLMIVVGVEDGLGPKSKNGTMSDSGAI